MQGVQHIPSRLNVSLLPFYPYVYINSLTPQATTDTLIGFDFEGYSDDSNSQTRRGYSNSQLSIPIYTTDFSFTCSDLSDGCWFPSEGYHTITSYDNMNFNYNDFFFCVKNYGTFFIL